ncbi:carboxypeptidase-like regulatory domain-containing protein [Arenibacter sp. GZD96]|uniref:carboxypeptidase-like regulatory domain-containing protein n=1 Tax=Aurantibrevibacter litoralis TaxID=3106030 RepID=UPI002B003D45|nr:carboxypeptidase-like regulatory domain-containing protein [Arenibacter sp. GZD-96]MEA1785561.1 carboxypeptidase-like regulatory domain-containing protein [Arenibacter sp. GZD-96]
MFRNILLLFVLVCLVFSTAKAQQLTMDLSGVVQSTEKDISDVHVLNITSKRAAITDENGNFSIGVTLGDTLVFSAIQFQRKQIVVSATILQTEFLTVSLVASLVELEEVVVRLFNLSGDLARDVDHISIDLLVTASSLELPNAHVQVLTQSERQLYTARTWDFTGNSIKLDPLINYFSGRTKRLKNKVTRDKKAARLVKSYEHIADSLFIVQLKIPKEKIDDFMFYCEADPKFEATIAASDTLAIWKFLTDMSDAYRKNNGLK